MKEKEKFTKLYENLCKVGVVVIPRFGRQRQEDYNSRTTEQSLVLSLPTIKL